MKITLLSLVFLLFGTAASPTATAADAFVEMAAETGTVIGTVTNARGPVAGSLVILRTPRGGMRTQSDRRGQFRFRAVPQGRHVIGAVAPTGESVREQIGVRSGATTAVRLRVR